MINEKIVKLLSELPNDEQKEVIKGIELWNNMDIFEQFPDGGKITNDVLKDLINNIILNTWINAKNYFKNIRKN